MTHPLYGPPSHKLERVAFTLHLPDRRNGYLTRLEARGETSTQRRSLWTVSEQWTAGEVSQGLQPADAIQHLALVASQDHPASQEALERSLTGGGWEDVALPF